MNVDQQYHAQKEDEVVESEVEGSPFTLKPTNRLILEKDKG